MYTAGIDVGSTYTKAVIFAEGRIVGREMVRTGFRLADAALNAYCHALLQAELGEQHMKYIVSTGYGRYQVPFSDLQVTDPSAQARGALFFFPKTRTVLDIGGQAMKASRINDGKVKAFRLNDKCAAGIGAFLEKTARTLDYTVEDIGLLSDVSKEPVTISNVCAVFAESEVINHVMDGVAPPDIMLGAMASLVERAVQLIKCAQMKPEYTVAGGVLRFETMLHLLSERLNAKINVPPSDLVQYTSAVGAAILAQQRLKKRKPES